LQHAHEGLDGKVQERLINWGDAICDAALRAQVDRSPPHAPFPCPEAGVG
jgi:NTE family protein